MGGFADLECDWKSRMAGVKGKNLFNQPDGSKKGKHKSDLEWDV
jgi:hypothetical protein